MYAQTFIKWCNIHILIRVEYASLIYDSKRYIFFLLFHSFSLLYRTLFLSFSFSVCFGITFFPLVLRFLYSLFYHHFVMRLVKIAEIGEKLNTLLPCCQIHMHTHIWIEATEGETDQINLVQKHTYTHVR